MNLYIRGGHVVDPAQGLDRRADVWIENGRVAAILSPKEVPPKKPDREIDATGLVVAPGLVDVHSHLREPGQTHKEDIETGTKAAVAGGFTTVLCMPNTYPVNDSAEVTNFIREKIHQTAHCKVWPVGAVTKGLGGSELAPLKELRQAGCVAFSDDGRPIVDTRVFREALEITKDMGVPLVEHCEDPELSQNPTIAEGEVARSLGFSGLPVSAETADATRSLVLAGETGGHLHLAHISCGATVELLEKFKEKVPQVTSEVTPHHLVLTDEAILTHGTNAKMYPPLRHEEDCEVLRKALGNDVIDMVATDHAPHSEKEKSLSFSQAPNGIIGFETCLPILLSMMARRFLTLSQVVSKLATVPARVFHLPCGTLKPGVPADVVVFSTGGNYPVCKEDFISKSRNTPFLGFFAGGRVHRTIVGGEVVFTSSET